MEGNQRKMREALTLIVGYEEVIYACVQSGHESGVDLEGIVFAMIDKAKEALSAPPRQCDVGTAEEQSERMEKSVCSKHHGCVRCPLRKAKYSDCSLGWAQTPYAEEGAGK